MAHRKRKTPYLYPEDADWLRRAAIWRNLQLVAVWDEMIAVYRELGSPEVNISYKTGAKEKLSVTMRPEDDKWLSSFAKEQGVSVPTVVAWMLATYRSREVGRQITLYNPETGNAQLKIVGQDYPPTEAELKVGRPVGS